MPYASCWTSVEAGVSFPGAIETATSVLSFATSVAEAARQNGPRRRPYAPIVRALRSIYFTPRGTLRVLRALAEDEEPSPDDIAEIVPDFNDAEWRVARMIEVLDFDDLARFEDLPLRQRRILQEIAWGKRNLRRDIQGALNEPLTHQKKVRADEAKILLGRVEALNRMIESLEEELL